MTKKKELFRALTEEKVPTCTVLFYTAYYSEWCRVNYFDGKQYGNKSNTAIFPNQANTQRKWFISFRAEATWKIQFIPRVSVVLMFWLFTGKSDFGSMVIQLSTHSESQKFCYFCNTTT